MVGFLDRFRREIDNTVRKESDQQQSVAVDDKIALGVLLQVVAQADEKFLPAEKEKIRDVLKDYAQIPAQDMDVILQAIDQAEKQSIDLFTFTHEVSQNLSYAMKKEIIEILFRVACVDHDLAHEENEMIRKISGLFRLEHKDFVDIKLKIKKECGLG